MSNLSSANVTDINLVLKERTHMHLCINMLIFTQNLGNWLISTYVSDSNFSHFLLFRLLFYGLIYTRHIDTAKVADVNLQVF